MKNFIFTFILSIFAAAAPAQDFIANHVALAQTADSAFGIPASIKLAQAMLETGSGTSVAYKRYNAAFGIRCTEPNHDAHSSCERYVDAGDSINLRIYNNLHMGFFDHSLYITSGKYKNMVKVCGRDPYKWADELQRRGYAADPDYAKKLKALIRQHGLTTYD